MKEGLPNKNKINTINPKIMAILATMTVATFLFNKENKNIDMSNTLTEEMRKEVLVRLDELQSKHNRFSKEKDSSKKAGIMTSAEIQEMKNLFVIIYAPLAQKISQKYGIPVSVSLGQAMLESGSGSSDLARNANNLFGIKHMKHCKEKFKDKNLKCCIQYADDEVFDRFLRFKNVEESFKAHAMMFYKDRNNTKDRKSGNYRSCFDCANEDYVCWLREIKSAGYATDPDYVEKVIRMIEENKLYLFDKDGVYDTSIE
jgi:flagellum-specific peptidoglycan hydrolase FlgJ